MTDEQENPMTDDDHDEDRLIRPAQEDRDWAFTALLRLVPYARDASRDPIDGVTYSIELGKVLIEEMGTEERVAAFVNVAAVTVAALTAGIEPDDLAEHIAAAVERSVG